MLRWAGIFLSAIKEARGGYLERYEFMPMNELDPLVISVVGSSGAGKTTLIEKLLRELSKRKYTTAAVKHCPHGFDLDVEGKDSWRFAEAGARGIFLTSARRIGLIKSLEHVPTLRSIAKHYFYDLDIVFGEGFSEEKEVSKIVVIRKAISKSVTSPRDDIVALVSDFEIETEKPVFKFDDVSHLADLIEQLLIQQRQLLIQENRAEGSVRLNINKKTVPLNAFVQSIFKNVILGVVATLRKEDKELEEIEIKVRHHKGVKQDE